MDGNRSCNEPWYACDISTTVRGVELQSPADQKSIVPLWWLPIFFKNRINYLWAVSSRLDHRQRDVINVIHPYFSIQLGKYCQRQEWCWKYECHLLQHRTDLMLQIAAFIGYINDYVVCYNGTRTVILAWLPSTRYPLFWRQRVGTAA